MPAAAVIPAPIVYFNVVAVKKLVVEFLIFETSVNNIIRLGNRLEVYPST